MTRLEEAESRCFLPSFTDEDAAVMLDNNYGSRACMLAMASSCPNVGVRKAIEKLGGKTQPGWGITIFPKWREHKV